MSSDKTNIPYLDVAAILARFGGVRALVDTAEAAGLDSMNVKTVRKWLTRGSIPIARLLELKALARLHRIPFSLDFFIKWS